MMDIFTRSYIAAALWSTMDNASKYSPSDIAPETITKIVEDCRKFQRDNAAEIGHDFDRAGHDFWLTRNHHGAGFWDGDWPEEVGDRLTTASHAFSEVDLYVGDDGLIYG